MSKLTKREVDSATANGERDGWLWDGELKGFGLRVRPSGRKVYLIEYRPGAGGRGAQKRRFTIGVHGSPWTAETARKEARRLLGVVANGGDPADEKAANKAVPLVDDVIEQFLDEHVRPKRKQSTADEYDRLLRLFVKPAIGRKRVVDVIKRDIQKFHNGLVDTPYQANRVLAVVSTLFTFAGVDKNPAAGIEPFPEKARERMLSPQELGFLGEAMADAEKQAAVMADYERQVAEVRQRFAAARAANDRKVGGAARRELAELRANRPKDAIPPQALACFRLLFFTGARSSEILTMQRPWIDFARGAARLPDSKGGAKTIHLSAPALEVLANAPRFFGNPYVIPGERPGAHFVGIQRPWRLIRNAATVKAWAADEHSPAAAFVAELTTLLGRSPTYEECMRKATTDGIELAPELSNLRIHDLRHAFASVAAASGMGLPIIGKMLGHARPSTTQRYAHLAPDPVKAAAAVVADKIAAGLAASREVEVVPLSQAAD